MNTCNKQYPLLRPLEPEVHQKTPFHLSSYRDLFTNSSFDLLQESFQQVEWERDQTDFYTQYESVIDPREKHAIAKLYHPSCFNPFKTQLENIVQTPLRNITLLVAHKLIASDEIDVHNDFCPPKLGGEQFRFIFQFAEEGSSKEGGEISFLSSLSKQDVICTHPYSSNTGICFEITPESYHFVAPVEDLRYTLIMYLWSKERPYDGSGYEILSNG